MRFRNSYRDRKWLAVATDERMGSTNGTTEKHRRAVALAKALTNGKGETADAGEVLEAARRAGVQNRDLVRVIAQLKAGLPPEVDDGGDGPNYDGDATPFCYEPHAVSFDEEGRAIHGRGDVHGGEHEDR